VAPARGAAPVPPPPADAADLPAQRPKAPEPAPVTASIYGFVELDAMHDSTQSFSEAVVNNTIARPSTLAGDNPRTQITARNSRLGLKLTAPDAGCIKTSGLVEVDFFGNAPATAPEDAISTSPGLRMRHFYVKFETPLVDVLAGQYHDLFGWGGYGFYPNTVAYLGVPGEIYHRDPQLRISKHVESDGSELDVAFAAVKPAQRDGEIPDFQGGVRLAWNRWQGATSQGASPAKAAPVAIGLSGITRHFSVPAFSISPANPNKLWGWGAAVNAFIPIVPAHGDDLGNALSLTAEVSRGTGIANLYTGLSGGVLFPSLNNPLMQVPVPMYTPGIDQGLVTYDADNNLHSVNWGAAVVGLQYRAPFEQGRRLWLSGIVAQLESSNSAPLTPQSGRPYVFKKARYFDANVFLAITAASQLGLSVQGEEQTFGDGAVGRNLRGQVAVYYFF